MDKFDGTHIHASGRLGNDQNRGVEGKFSCNNHLLHISAGHGTGIHIDAGAPDIKFLVQIFCIALDGGGALLEAEAVETLLFVLAHQEIVRHGGVSADAGGQPVFRNVGQTHSPDFSRGPARHILAADQDLSLRRRAHARNGLQELALAVALDGGNAQNLSCPDGKGNIPDRLQAPVVIDLQVLRLNGHLAGSAGFFQMVIEHRPAHHHGGQLLFGHVAGVFHAHQLALAHDAHPVGNGHDFVQFMGDDNDRHAQLLHHPADDGKELVGLLGGEDGGGLVQNEDVRSPVEGFEDLHSLLQAHADLLNDGFGIHHQAIFVHQLLGLFFGSLVIEEDLRLSGLPAHDNILCHSKRRDQHEMLMHHADALGNGIFRIKFVHLFSPDQDLTIGRFVDAVENIHQCGFSRSVFSYQSKNLSLPDLEGNVIVGKDAGELHADMAKFYCYIHSSLFLKMAMA